MPPILASAIIALVYLIAGAAAGAGALFLGGKLAKAPDNSVNKAAMTGFTAALVAGSFYRILLLLMDKSDQPLMNPAFYAGVAAGLGISYVVVMKGFEVEPNKIPIIWLPFGIALFVLLFAARTQGNAFKESLGFYRGYEKFAALNLLDPPNAMSTPEKGVDFYIEQLNKLKHANEDEGIGKLLMTASHWDAKWFSENFQFITKKQSKVDLFGITVVLQSPNQHKVLALMELAKPLYGKPEEAKTDGKEAIVRMSSGQIVRLYKEGRNWKIRDWLGNKSVIWKEIMPIKEKDGYATAEDQKEKANNFATYESETRALCEKLGIKYESFNPYLSEDDFETGPDGKLVRVDPETKSSSRLARAKPGELIDESEDVEVEEDGKEKPAAGNRQIASVPPPGQPIQPGSAVIPGELQEPGAPQEPDAAPSPSQPDLSNFDAPPPTPVATPVATPMPLILENIPVETLWPQYFAAVQKVNAGDPSGVRAMENVMSADDVAWLQRNYVHLVELLTPGAQYSSPETGKLVVLRAILRNMPQDPKSKVKASTKVGVGVAKLTDPNSRQEFSTAIVQEHGRWVLAHMFFSRDFVWVPQLAYYKKMRSIPLSQDESIFAQAGFAPFQAQVRTVYSTVGVGG